MRDIRSSEPFKVKFPSGATRSFLLTKKAIRELRRELQVKTTKDLLDLEADSIVDSLLRVTMVEGDPISQEEMDSLPYDPEWSAIVVLGIFGHSMPDADPNAAAPVLTKQPEQVQ